MKEYFRNGTKKEDIGEVCLAVLAVATNEQQYFNGLEKILTDGNTLGYVVVDYLQKHAYQNSDIEKVLMRNEDVNTTKQNKTDTIDN